MITPAEIKEKALKNFRKFLVAEITGQDFFPLFIPFTKIKASETLKNFTVLQKAINDLKNSSRDKKGRGYSVDSVERADRKIGLQSFPSRIYFETRADYLYFTGQKNDYTLFKKNLDRIRQTLPDLKDWLIKNPLKLMTAEQTWIDLLKVCHYFIEHSRPGLYIRELPIAVHTKFIEEHKSLVKSLLDFLIPDQINPGETVFEKRFSLKYPPKLIRLKILDQKISQTYLSGLSDLSIPVQEFNQLALDCKRVIIMENKTNFANILNFLTLPGLTATIALFGSGFGVGVLKHAAWLKTKEIYYWGDIDGHGFSILSLLRAYLPGVKSIMMDLETWHRFSDYAVDGPPADQLPAGNLTIEERELYLKLLPLTNKNRLEQEKISHSYATERLKAVFK